MAKKSKAEKARIRRSKEKSLKERRSREHRKDSRGSGNRGVRTGKRTRSRTNRDKNIEADKAVEELRLQKEKKQEHPNAIRIDVAAYCSTCESNLFFGNSSGVVCPMYEVCPVLNDHRSHNNCIFSYADTILVMVIVLGYSIENAMKEIIKTDLECLKRNGVEYLLFAKDGKKFIKISKNNFASEILGLVRRAIANGVIHEHKSGRHKSTIFFPADYFEVDRRCED